MGFLIQVVILGFLTLSFSSCGDICKNNAKCIVPEECVALHQQSQDVKDPLLFAQSLQLHCGFSSNNTAMICCPPEISTAHVEKDHPENLLPNRDSCGKFYKSLLRHTRTDLDEYPWVALLKYDRKYGSGYYCGGVLISRRYVLTAAHCVKGSDIPSTWKLSQVRLGDWNLTSEIDCLGGDCSPAALDVTIEEAITHEVYDPRDTNQLNDIAILRLSRDIPFTDYVMPICLPLNQDLSENTLESYNGYNMEVAGWGKPEIKSTSNVKLMGYVPLVKNEACQRAYRSLNINITDKQLCAGGSDGQQICTGDSGGPLMAPIKDNMIVFGVASYRPYPCGFGIFNSWPGVYTRVVSYTNWILSKIRP